MMRKALVAFSLLLAVFVLLLMTDEVINKRVFSEETSPIPLFSCTAIVPLTGQQGEAVQFQGSVAEYGQVTIDPGGGEYSFSNGVTLEVPADAVSESTTVGIRLLEKEEVEPVLQSYGFTEKYFMAGFEAVPAGLSFNQPIKVTLPSELLRGTTDVPLPFIVDAENQIYCYDTPGSSSSAVMDINKKLKGMQSEREILEYYYDPETGNKIKITVEKFPDRQKVIEAVAEIIDVVPEDCKATPPPCSCIVVRLYERMKDLIVEGECSFIDLEGSSEFTQCPGKPKVEFKFIEDQRGKIRITPSSAELKIGDTETFTWELIDANGIPIPAHSITAYIKDENVANTFEWQEGFGKVRAINCGKTKLIVEAGCENRGEASIKVISEAASIEIDPPAKTELEVCETLQLTAKVFDKCENELEDQTFKWSWTSPDTGVIDLNENTGYLEGKVKGTVKATAEASGKKGHIDLTINQSVADIYIQPNISTINVGEELALSVSLEDNCGESLMVEDHNIEWIIPPGGVIAFDPENLNVVGISLGEATLTATCEGKSATTTIIVVSRVASIEIDPKEATVCVGDSLEIEVVVLDKDGNEIEEYEIDWTLSGGGIASFDPETGTVTGVSPGIFTLTPTCEGISATATITVVPQAALVEVSPEKGCVKVNETLQLKATVKDKDGNILEDYPVTWYSDESKASVDQNGLVTGVSGGFAYIVAAAPCGNYGWAIVGVQTVSPNYVLTLTLSSILYDINNNGQLLTGGGFFDLLDEEGLFTDVQIDGSLWSRCEGINDSGKVVGWHSNNEAAECNNSLVHGFIYENGNYAYINASYDGPYAIFLSGINNMGHIVGSNIDCREGEMGPPLCPDWGWRDYYCAFIYTGGVFYPIYCPEDDHTVSFEDINDLGQAVGTRVRFCGPDNYHGFLYDGGNFTAIEFPGAIATYCEGINNYGHIVGSYFDPAEIRHGFIYDGSKFITIDIPSAYATRCIGINDFGQIVGQIGYGGEGFLITPCPWDDGTPLSPPPPDLQSFKAKIGSNTNHKLTARDDSIKRDSSSLLLRVKPNKKKKHD